MKIEIIVGTFFAVFYLIGLIFCAGHGGTLLGGYHYQPKTKRAMKYHRQLMLRVGLWFIFMSACIHIAIMFAIYKKLVWFGIFLAISIAVAIIGIIYINTSKKIKTLMKLEKDDNVENLENEETK